MGTITRPSGGFTDSTVAYAADVNSDFDEVYNEFNGNIDDSNIKTTAAIKGTKFADSPNGIPTAKLNDLAVTGPKLSSSGSNDALRAVDTDHIKNDAVEARCVADEAILEPHLKLATYDWAPGGTITIGSLSVDTGLLLAEKVPLNLRIEKSGAANKFLDVEIHIDTSDDHIWLVARNVHWNPSAVPVDMTGITIKMLYISVS